MSGYEKVVITGMGALSPVGTTARATFDALTRGQSGIRNVTWKLPAGAECRVGAYIDDANVPEIGEGGFKDREYGRYSRLAYAAVREALADSGVKSAGYESSRIATILGAGLANGDAVVEATTQLSTGRYDSITLGHGDYMAPHLATELIAQLSGATGPSCCMQSACASSANAIGYGFELVRNGIVDTAIVGGSEAPVSPFVFSLFERIGAMTKYPGEPELASRPFDRERSGFVMGEGSAMMVLETETNARKRGARIYAEIAGYGASADAFHVTKPQVDGIGMARAIEGALRVAEVDRQAVDYVNAHGTGTEFNDLAETMALKHVFGEHARKLWVSSNKSMIGHLLGGAAAIETVATAYSLYTGVVPPTRNLDHPDEKCDLDYVPHEAREKRLRVAIKNSFGFGGQNASLVLRAV